MATTMIMKKTPMESSSRLLSAIELLLTRRVLLPHSGQNFEPAGIDLPQLGQVIAPAAGGVSVFPHSGQNFEVAGTLGAAVGTDH